MTEEKKPPPSAANDLDEVAELDRRWAAIEAGEATVPHDEVVRLGHSGVQAVERAMKVQRSIDARLLALKWMVGLVIALETAVLVRVFVL